MCCTCHFQSGSLCLASSVCWSLQCLISALTQGGGGGFLFRFTCSVVLWGGRGTADKYHWCVWGALSVFWPHWVCPHSRVCAFCLHCSGSQLLYREWALICMNFPNLSCSGSGSQVLHKDTDSVGPAFCSQSEQFRRPGAWRMHSLQVQCDFFPPHPSLSFRALQSPVCCVSLLGSWSLAATLLADVNRTESQKACSQFGRECPLWGQVCPFPALAGTRLPPATGRGWASL